MGKAEEPAGDLYSPLKGGHAMFTNRVFRWAVLAVLVLGCALVVRVLAEEANSGPDQEPTLFLKMYDVKDLLCPRKDHPYCESGLPTFNATFTGWIITHAGPLFPGGGEPEPPPGWNELIGTIQVVVNSQRDPDVAAWTDNGGPACIEYLPSVLVVTQTAAGHKKIEDFLAQYRRCLHGGATVTISAKWMQLNADKAEGLTGARGGADVQEVAPAALKDAGAQTVYSGQVRCLDCQTVHLVAAEYQAYVADVEPAADGTLNPWVSAMLIGPMLEVRPVLSPDGQSVVLDVRSFVTELKGMRSWPLPDFRRTEDNADTQKPAIDIPCVYVHTFASTAKAPLGKLVLIGGMTQPGAEKGKVLCLVLEVTAVK